MLIVDIRITIKHLTKFLSPSKKLLNDKKRKEDKIKPKYLKFKAYKTIPNINKITLK